jgi:hypothetical protein
MAVTSKDRLPWLLLVFSLPAKNASQRVLIWRKLRRYGVLALRSSGYVLPNNAINQERLEWLATAIRSSKGFASVVQVQAFDDLPADKLEALFIEERSRDYQKLLHELKRFLSLPASRRPNGKLNRFRRRYQEVRDIDFFRSPLREKLEKALAQAQEPASHGTIHKAGRKAAEFQNRLWMTRPRPGIDRVSSAWLIRRFIDPKARFAFATEPQMYPDAIPFDMFTGEGFGHRGDDCTFETLCKEFGVRDGRVKRVAQVVHDADLGDEKYGRLEGQGLDCVLNGWAKQDMPDSQLLERGMELIEGLYESTS